MAARSGNGELVASITALGDRLHLARHLDEQIVGDKAAELDALAAALTSGTPHGTRNLLLRYHERRAGDAATYGIGSAARCERVCPAVWISVVAVSLNNTTDVTTTAPGTIGRQQSSQA